MRTKIEFMVDTIEEAVDITAAPVESKKLKGLLFDLIWNKLRTKHWDYETEADIAVAEFANRLRDEIAEELSGLQIDIDG